MFLKQEKILKLKKLLQEALSFVAESDNNFAWSHLSQHDMQLLISESISNLEAGDIDKRLSDDLWRLFAPTSDWDDIQGSVELGEAIFSLVDQLYGKPAF